MTPPLELAAGSTARVSAPATSANLGPGYDSLGLALDVRDEYSAVVSDRPGVRVAVEGLEADSVPTGSDHLVARAMLRGLAHWGVSAKGIDLYCLNRIPHGRGLGSSAAAIVGGLSLAARLAGPVNGHSPSDDDLLNLAADVEGHPDNVAAAMLGGFTIAWTSGDRVSAVSLAPNPDIMAVVYVPEATCPTTAARAALPGRVPHADAAFNAGRAALVVAAITSDPSLLFPATEDRLHQTYRSASYPEAIQLVGQLRARGVAAFVSGAGPAVLALTTDAGLEAAGSGKAPGYAVMPTRIGAGAAAD
ncbi:MAG: homoserine kinase [Candidatus Nanopelagicales bacterium]|nr:homoserine kinase [Candidatus Nanopelagicales bacterium]MDZ4249127.1 homoserine kinase [Candidatus Nanopelagicales bacterium]